MLGLIQQDIGSPGGDLSLRLNVHALGKTRFLVVFVIFVVLLLQYFSLCFYSSTFTVLTCPHSHSIKLPYPITLGQSGLGNPIQNTFIMSFSNQHQGVRTKNMEKERSCVDFNASII